MKPSDARVQPIFNDALDYPAGDERENYLQKACGSDAPLRARVEALLRAHETAGSFLTGGRTDRESPGDH